MSEKRKGVKQNDLQRSRQLLMLSAFPESVSHRKQKHGRIFPRPSAREWDTATRECGAAPLAHTLHHNTQHTTTAERTCRLGSMGKKKKKKTGVPMAKCMQCLQHLAFLLRLLRTPMCQGRQLNSQQSL